MSDLIEYGPPPAPGEGPSFGTCAVRANGLFGVRVMIRSFDVTVEGGAPIAFVDMRIPSAVQAVQAIRQAISDARKGRLR